MSTELSEHDNSIFYDENNNKINHLEQERDEQLDAFVFLDKNSTVLELGARYGTVSCLINRILTNKENHVAVEPELGVIDALTKNRDSQECKFHIFNGVVSKKLVDIIPGGYGTMTIPNENIHESSIVSMTLDRLQEKYSLKFDVIVADCEGCICQFTEENDMSQFKMILLEKDQCGICNYEKVETHLKNLGFLKIREYLYYVFRTVYINMNFLPFNILSYEVFKGTIGLFGKLGYLSGNDVNVNVDEGSTLSAHAPSKVLIETNVPLRIQGFCSSSSQKCPKLVFKCNNIIIGNVEEINGRTLTYKINPGQHELIIETDDTTWAHSVWIFRK